MYEFRSLPLTERLRIVRERLNRGFPAHAPPHVYRGPGQYMVTAACYEHRPHMLSASRRAQFAKRLLDAATADAGGNVHAWVVLPNHYHLLWEGTLSSLEEAARKLHAGSSTQWNREDCDAGRTCWYRLADRKIRSEAHYYASVNYIHVNPMKHGWTRKADDWNATSLTGWLDRMGRGAMRDMWTAFPVDKYGEGWDD